MSGLCFCLPVCPRLVCCDERFEQWTLFSHCITNSERNAMLSTSKQAKMESKRSKIALKKFLQKGHSSSATLDTECSSCCSEGIEVFRVERKLRFATTSSGKIQCKVKVVEKYSDPALWWQQHELDQGRQECARLMASTIKKCQPFCKAMAKFLRNYRALTDQELSHLYYQMNACHQMRGLECYLVNESDEHIQKQYERICRVQASSGGSTALVRLASRSVSRAFEELAFLRAAFDEEEAGRAYRTPWKIEDIAIFFD